MVLQMYAIKGTTETYENLEDARERVINFQIMGVAAAMDILDKAKKDGKIIGFGYDYIEQCMNYMDTVFETDRSTGLDWTVDYLISEVE